MLEDSFSFDFTQMIRYVPKLFQKSEWAELQLFLLIMSAM